MYTVRDYVNEFVLVIQITGIWNSEYLAYFNNFPYVGKFEGMAFAECVFVISYDSSCGPQIRSVFPRGFVENLDQSLESLVFPKGVHTIPNVKLKFSLLS